jgi:hypothetical protein
LTAQSSYENDITKGHPIKTNVDWGPYVGGVDVKISSYGAGNEALGARWTFERMGRPVVLDGDIGEFACFRMNDNFSGLVQHYFHFQGFRVKKLYS